MQEEEKKKNKKENKTKIEELNLKIKSLEEEVLRSKADLINYRKRKDDGFNIIPTIEISVLLLENPDGIKIAPISAPV